jgi:hypothetical protein
MTREIVVSTFTMNGLTIDLIDTPGFDDTTLADTAVLNIIAKYLMELSVSHTKRWSSDCLRYNVIDWNRYEENTKLSGILYFHRIIDPRMSGSAMKNGRMFRRLCGDRALKNMLLVTTHWDEVKTNIGEAREAELCGDFWKDMIAGGAEVVRFDRTRGAAFEILQKLIPKERVVVQLQEEMRDGVTAGETSVGKEINNEINTAKAIAQKEVEEARKMMEEADTAARARAQEELTQLTLVREEQLRLSYQRQDELNRANAAREVELQNEMQRRLWQQEEREYQRRIEIEAVTTKFEEMCRLKEEEELRLWQVQQALEARRQREAQELQRKREARKAEEVRRQREAQEVYRQREVRKAQEVRRQRQATEALRQRKEEARRQREAQEAHRRELVQEARQRKAAQEARRRREAQEAYQRACFRRFR